MLVGRYLHCRGAPQLLIPSHIQGIVRAAARRMNSSLYLFSNGIVRMWYLPLRDGKQLLILCQTAARWWSFFVSRSYFEILCQPNWLQESNLDCWYEKSTKRTIFNLWTSRKQTFALFSKVKENKGSENACNSLTVFQRISRNQNGLFLLFVKKSFTNYWIFFSRWIFVFF